MCKCKNRQDCFCIRSCQCEKPGIDQIDSCRGDMTSMDIVDDIPEGTKHGDLSHPND